MKSRNNTTQRTTLKKIFDKLIVHTTYLYISEALKNEVCYQRDSLIEVKSKLAGLHIAYKFTDDEHKALVDAGSTEEAKRIKDKEIDFSIFAISLICEYIADKPKKERIQFNMSDAKINTLMACLVRDMLELKHRDESRYANTKEIVEHSKSTSKEFYQYFKDNLCTMD